MAEENDPFEDSPVIFRYTRRRAIEDGVLVDLTQWAREAGFAYPVACTAAIWNGYLVAHPPPAEVGQSERGRAHDLLVVLRHAIAGLAVGASPDRLEFEVTFMMPPDRHVVVRLTAVCGPGDHAEPVITIMLPGEY